MSFFRRILAAVMTLCLLVPMTAAARPLEDGTPMSLTSPAAILAETATGTIIFEKNADERREVRRMSAITVCTCAGSATSHWYAATSMPSARRLCTKAFAFSSLLLYRKATA